LSNIPWDDFYSRACAHLLVDEGSAHLAYYMSKEGFDSGRTRLQGEDDWKLVMATIREAVKRHEVVEFEVLNVNIEVCPRIR
jgi:hypothetical protein